jgi:hypothetical protein
VGRTTWHRTSAPTCSTCGSLRGAIRTINDFGLSEVNQHAVHQLSFLVKDVLTPFQVAWCSTSGIITGAFVQKPPRIAYMAFSAPPAALTL